MSTQQDIIAANKLTANNEDWVKEERRIEIGAQEMVRSRHRSHYEHTGPVDRRSEALQEIVEENVEAARKH